MSSSKQNFWCSIPQSYHLESWFSEKSRIRNYQRFVNVSHWQCSLLISVVQLSRICSINFSENNKIPWNGHILVSDYLDYERVINLTSQSVGPKHSYDGEATFKQIDSEDCKSLYFVLPFSLLSMDPAKIPCSLKFSNTMRRERTLD